MRIRLYLTLLLAAGCAQYQTHDPKSYCRHRHLEPRLRPSVVCRGTGDGNGPDCKSVVTVEMRWKCDDWTSW